MIQVIDPTGIKEDLTPENYEIVKQRSWWVFTKGDDSIECVGLCKREMPDPYQGLIWEPGEEIIDIYTWPSYDGFIALLEDGFARKAALDA